MQGTPKAIEIKGIVRNATVIGAQDGQAEDLINLRFMDGSWRASGDGRLVHTMSGTQYTQLYVHTNVYHHLLGVNNGTLYWFAEIGTDGVSFYPLDGTTSRTNWPQDMQSLPTSPVALTTVVGDIWITQTGHLLTIIDESDDFEYLVFKTGDKKYIEVNIDVNGKATDRKLFPFNYIHLNCFCPYDDAHKIEPEIGDSQFEVPYQATDVFTNATRKKNFFSQHFLAIVAFKLYDGSYAYACNPIHLCPREQLHYQPGVKRWINVTPSGFDDFNILIDTTNVTTESETSGYVEVTVRSDDGVLSVTSENAELVPEVSPWQHIKQRHRIVEQVAVDTEELYGSDLALSFDNSLIENFDENIFQSLCVFVTTESNIYPTVTSLEDLQNRLTEFKVVDESLLISAHITYQVYRNESYIGSESFQAYIGGSTFNPYTKTAIFRKEEDIIYDLLHSPFYLIREYKKSELYELATNPVVNLQDAEHKGILKTENLVQQPTLPIEATARTTYLPKVSYMYNGRLHIANYKSYPFFGYPIDLFHLHNHSVKVQADSWFKGVLPNLADNNETYLQYTKAQKSITNYEDLVTAGAPYFLVKVYIDSSQGEQVVCRYIPAYNPSPAVNGRADFIEDLNPLLTYPDARAKKMDIYYVNAYYPVETHTGQYTVYDAGAQVYKKSFNLKPHPYLNLAYYIDQDLKPIKLSTFTNINPIETLDDHTTVRFHATSIDELKALANMVNTEEYFPNGLKVSKTDNPMFFPVENAYQVGSAEILALMSNTIAVGTGQTGAAPLYVFCKDGVYALFVDASGQMTYSNSRVLARDVCNNPRSVTPIDAGVVFTTDRGLMMIAGEQVEEIGQPAEGDVLHYTNVNAQGQPLSVEGSKIATDALTKIAGLPSSLCDTTDFLTYLQDKGTLGKAAIVNYNHNMRELIISNPNYAYSYVLDREGNWSRRDYTAAEYVNNYPTSYRVDADGRFYKLDDEGDASTSLEHRKEADNQIFYLSNVIKLDSIGFKQAYRFVVRGYFEVICGTRNVLLGSFQKPRDLYDSNTLYNLDSAIYDSLEVGDTLILINKNWHGSTQTLNVESKTTGPNRIVLSGDIQGNTGDYDIYKVGAVVDNAIACVVEGSYDGIKFAPLGFNRKTGKFTNIGCHVSHTDVRFFRVILCGQVTGKTRIDYMEMSANGSVLNTKIR